MLYNSSLWISDIDRVLINVPELGAIEGKSVMITGASGLIGSAIVDVLFRYNDTYEAKIQIVAAGRQRERMLARFGDMINRDDFTFVTYDANRLDNNIDVNVDYIIHGASHAYPSLIVNEPVETMLSNVLGIFSLLDYAKKSNAKRMLFISSSEVYGEKSDPGSYSEGEYGFIDLLNPRNSYSMAKRAAETLCVSYSTEYGVESVIVRPGHVYGPTASPYDNRVASAWAYSAARKEDIVMKSEGNQLRSYCYCLDCASAILKVLLKGENCSAYNVSNQKSIITIRQMAEMLAESAGTHVIHAVPSDEDKRGFNPMSDSSLDGSKLARLGWNGCFDARIGFAHTVRIIQEKV